MSTINKLIPKKSRFRQGKFQPQNPEKYVGNVNKIRFLSSYERKFMIYADTNPDIINWSSETIAVPYYSPLDKKWHNYYPDIWLYIKRPDGNTKCYIIEIKPESQLKAPKLKGERQTQKKLDTYLYEGNQYIVNALKFDAATKYAQERGWEFRVVTEKFLGIK